MRASPRPRETLDHFVALRHPIGDAPAYATPEDFAADLAVIAGSLEASGARLLARGRLRALRRAVDVFGFHLAPLDLRQNSDVHERTRRRTVRRRRARHRISRSSTRKAASRCCARELVSPRPLLLPFHVYSDETAGELAIFRTAAKIKATYGAAAIVTAIISKCQGVSDMLELALLLKEVGLVGADGTSRINMVPLFETIDDLRACVGVMDRLLGDAGIRRTSSPRSAASRR